MVRHFLWVSQVAEEQRKSLSLWQLSVKIKKFQCVVMPNLIKKVFSKAVFILEEIK
jgi:hypothetical protein